VNLREARCMFAGLIWELLSYAREHDYNVALDEGMQHQEKGHMKGSLHYFGCAQDILLYDDEGNYLTDSEEYRDLGEAWKGMHSFCRWGGDFKDEDGKPTPDGGHFSFSVPELFGGRK
jgi:hypothetical protein